ncbi:MAG: signal peptidase I [Deltaproteobacteria bacterium]|nr:signal peptidase I [Deltaproteobacteria bacterium]
MKKTEGVLASDGAAQSAPSRGALREAKKLLDEAEKLAEKQKRKLSKEASVRVEAAIEALSKELEIAEDSTKLDASFQALDRALDDTLGYARKSTVREFFESIGVAVMVALALRAFVIEAFKIPSGSMIPTLEVGDHIFVNKFIYGLRIPMTNAWFFEWGSPARGDIIVFRFPVDLSKDYIKRVVAIAGDRVRVIGRDVFINGTKLDRAPPAEYTYVEDAEPGADAYDLGAPRKAYAFPESAHDEPRRYTVLYSAEQKFREPFPSGPSLPGLDCTPTLNGQVGECVVRTGYVFCMGDNRDNSYDSRGWGAVPVENIKGKAMFIWWSRGRESGIRWERIGTPVQ